jgi:hypothetical protein
VRHFLVGLAMVLIVSLGKQISAADFFLEPVPDGTDLAIITLVGNIERGDADRLKVAVGEWARRGHYADRINLFSPGGDAYEGILLGIAIFELKLQTSGPFWSNGRLQCYGHPGSWTKPFETHTVEGGKTVICDCASACAVAWLGGIERFGTAGFHRVWSPDPTATAEGMGDMRLQWEKATAPFLSMVGAPNFVKDLIDYNGIEAVGYPNESQAAILFRNVDYGNAFYAACQRFFVPVHQEQRHAQLTEAKRATGLSDVEEAELHNLNIQAVQEQRCHEEVRRSEIFAAQQSFWQ